VPEAAPERGPAGPASPFTTETLLRAAADQLRIRPRRAMALAQQLYQGVELEGDGRTGLITYPRTESCWVSTAADGMARALVTERHGTSAASALEVPQHRPAGGHEAIRPTSLEWPPERARQALRAAGCRDLLRLYALIWDRYLESRSTPACRSEVPGARPAATGPGPSGLGDAALLAMLADRGIGRPSTFATIGESLVARGYLARQGEELVSTPLGHRVVGWLDRTLPGTLDADFTASLEARFDEVEAGELAWRSAVAVAWGPLERVLGGGRSLDTPSRLLIGKSSVYSQIRRAGRTPSTPLADERPR